METEPTSLLPGGIPHGSCRSKRTRDRGVSNVTVSSNGRRSVSSLHPGGSGNAQRGANIMQLCQVMVVRCPGAVSSRRSRLA